MGIKKTIINAVAVAAVAVWVLNGYGDNLCPEESGKSEYKIPTNKYNKEAEAILNAITGSILFDSLNTAYRIKNPVFINHGLDSSLSLSYKKKTLKILDKSLISDNTFWNLGDFLLDCRIDNGKSARVQVALFVNNEEAVLIGIILQKLKEWEIKSIAFIE
jgi:hypothetical protein